MDAYTPKRYERGVWITRVVGTRNEWQRAFSRDYYTVRHWLHRNKLAIGCLIVTAVIVAVAATAGRTAAIYKSNERVPFLPSISAVRG